MNSPLDQFIKESLRVRGYVRYMDDMLLFADSKAALREAHRRAAGFLRLELRLELKDEATVLAPVSEGVPFLGLRLWPWLVRLDGPGRRRLIRALRRSARGLAMGRLSEEEASASMRSRLGHALQADTLGLRRSLAALMDLGPRTARAPTGSTGAGCGTTTPPTPGPPTATTTTRATGTTTSGSAPRAELAPTARCPASTDAGPAPRT